MRERERGLREESGRVERGEKGEGKMGVRMIKRKSKIKEIITSHRKDDYEKTKNSEWKW